MAGLARGNGVGHTNKVKLRRARLVLQLAVEVKPTQPANHYWEGFGRRLEEAASSALMLWAARILALCILD